VYLRDHRLGHLVQPRHHAYADREQLLVEGFVAARRQLREVVTGGECRPGAFDDEHARIRIRSDGVEGVDDFEHQRERQRIAPIGTIEHEARDRRRGELDVLVGHDVSRRTRLGGDDGDEKQYAARP
jgi:hypothetical protein